jgi:hypothetical protein
MPYEDRPARCSSAVGFVAAGRPFDVLPGHRLDQFLIDALGSPFLLLD